MDEQSETLEVRIEAIEARNRRVEMNSDWERSITRCGALVTTTYVAEVALLFVIDAPRPWLGTAVPTMGYLQ